MYVSPSAGSVSEEIYRHVITIDLSMKLVLNLFSDGYWTARSTWVNSALINSMWRLRDEVFTTLMAHPVDEEDMFIILVPDVIDR